MTEDAILFCAGHPGAPELYEAVAEILVFVDAMDKIKAKMQK